MKVSCANVVDDLLRDAGLDEIPDSLPAVSSVVPDKTSQ
jgi:hypothetical protein